MTSLPHYHAVLQRVVMLCDHATTVRYYGHRNELYPGSFRSYLKQALAVRASPPTCNVSIADDVTVHHTVLAYYMSMVLRYS